MTDAALRRHSSISIDRSLSSFADKRPRARQAASLNHNEIQDVGWALAGVRAARLLIVAASQPNDVAGTTRYVVSSKMFTRNVTESKTMRAAGNRPPPRKRNELSQVQ
jgi:hypothetical protein